MKCLYCGEVLLNNDHAIRHAGECAVLNHSIDRVLDFYGDPSEHDFQSATKELESMRRTLYAFSRAIADAMYETNRCPVCKEHYSKHAYGCNWVLWVQYEQNSLQ